MTPVLVLTPSNFNLYVPIVGGLVLVAAAFYLSKRTKTRQRPIMVPPPVREIYREQWYRVGFLSDTGRVRTNNEDAVLTLETLSSFESGRRSRILCAVADGVGGSNKGEVASKLTMQTIARCAEWMVQTKSLNIGSSLKSTVESANEAVVNYALEHPESEGMASTIVAAIIDGDVVYIAHAGDSRAYLINRDSVKRLTRDHSQVQELVDAGRITPEQALSYPGRNVITRAVGAATDLNVEMDQPLTLAPVDALLLCTDGLWDVVREPEMQQIVLATNDPQGACKQLVALANNRGGKDNISVVIVQCQGVPFKQSVQ
jgi:serine/threonine protein phosphatase PrpC